MSDFFLKGEEKRHYRGDLKRKKKIASLPNETWDNSPCLEMGSSANIQMQSQWNKKIIFIHSLFRELFNIKPQMKRTPNNHITLCGHQSNEQKTDLLAANQVPVIFMEAVPSGPGQFLTLWDRVSLSTQGTRERAQRAPTKHRAGRSLHPAGKHTSWSWPVLFESDKWTKERRTPGPGHMSPLSLGCSSCMGCKQSSSCAPSLTRSCKKLCTTQLWKPTIFRQALPT